VSGRTGRTERTLREIRRIAGEMLLDLPKPPRELRVRAGDVSLELQWPEPGSGGQPAPPAAQEPESGSQRRPDSEPESRPAGPSVCSPMVGIFYRAPEPGAAPFVAEGDQVNPGQQVAIIEAMKLMIPVEADKPGRIASVLVPDGQSVEYGQPLFALEPAS
jgi:acetyl-CoA carboxylase biotin carboxyl carrier protein